MFLLLQDAVKLAFICILYQELRDHYIHHGFRLRRHAQESEVRRMRIKVCYDCLHSLFVAEDLALSPTGIIIDTMVT